VNALKTYLLDKFKLTFLIFKQFYIYFHTFFHLHLFQKVTNIISSFKLTGIKQVSVHKRFLSFGTVRALIISVGENMYGVEADNGTITSSTTKQTSMDTWCTCSDPRTLLSFLSLHFRNEDIFKKNNNCTFFCLFIFALST